MIPPGSRAPDGVSEPGRRPRRSRATLARRVACSLALAQLAAAWPAWPQAEVREPAVSVEVELPADLPDEPVAEAVPVAPKSGAAEPSLVVEAAPVVEGTVARAPCAHRSPERLALFGDLHVHTRYSLDAATMDTRNSPHDAYRFARGERIGIQPHDAQGRPLRTVQLDRPLDFAAVTDHAEVFGELETCRDAGLEGHLSMQCRIYRGWPRVAFFLMNRAASIGDRPGFCGEAGSRCLEASRRPWQEMQLAAEAAYDRSDACRFTSFTGYEWTGSGSASANLHRNVIFENDIVPDLPTSFIDEPTPEGLWAALDRTCSVDKPGCDVVVIPHNSNLSDGQMFPVTLPDGQPIGLETAEVRHRFERLVEVMQHKGDSECRLGVQSEDELCGFEKLETTNMASRFMPWMNGGFAPRMFVRNVLKEGLVQERRLGVNPFEYGIIASTDTHLGTPGLVDESASFPGHGGAGKPPDQAPGGGLPDDADFNPGGLAAVWAEENSRSAIFAALKRRETFGTSGPRIVVRFFAGHGLGEHLCEAPDRVKRAYARGVPMGGTLETRSDPGAVPRFLVSALADPGTDGLPGTDLQRIQIVKGWLDGDTVRERVVDVAGGDNGASVDPLSCEPSGEGARELCATWVDPEFDASQPSFYYARVLENPTCRWSQRICRASGVVCEGDAANVPPGLEDCCSPSHVPTIQERAWSSPIWMRPEPG